METAITDPLHVRIAEIEKAALRAKNLTQQLLTFSKGGDPVRRPCDLSHLVKESAQFAVRGSNVRCEFTLGPDTHFSDIDEGQIAQVIHNLTLNAVQAMPEGGVMRIGADLTDMAPDNHLSLTPGRYVKLTIRDQGTGIRKEHLNKVFDPYFTTKQQGSGLGLAVAHSVVKKHDGRITIESELGIGTTFTIYLPALQKGRLAERDTGPILKAADGSILVMDDEDIIRHLAAQMLKKMGFEVTLAQNGQEALSVYRQALKTGRPFDAVILDLTVPGGMGGKETVERLLEIDPDVKAIVSSGYSNDPFLSDYARYGFQQAIGKPYRVQDLGDALRAVLNSEQKNETVDED